MFFHRCSYKNNCFSELAYNSCPCLNLMISSLRFKKDVLFSKMFLCFGFCAFGFEAILHSSYYLTSIVNETHHGSVIAPFSVQLVQLEMH